MVRLGFALLAMLWLGGSPSSPLAATIELGLPVDCTIGERCLVQKLFDHDPGSARLDYRCGALTTDGHDGVDFRLRTMADMATGVTVVAAAAGTVLRVRDQEPDVSARHRKDLNGKDAGNGVVIAHEGGWETQYSHLRLGSVRVRQGDRVEAGDPLGLIGMSGNAEFPHVHFSLRFEGHPVDPFTGPSIPGDCKNDNWSAGSLWTRSATRELGYRPSGVITAGMASSIPPVAVSDRFGSNAPLSRSDTLILWADAYGTMAGDIQRFRIAGPDDKVVFEQSRRLDRGALSWFAYAGRRAPAEGWPPGRYAGAYELVRDGTVIARAALLATVR